LYDKLHGAFRLPKSSGFHRKSVGFGSRVTWKQFSPSLTLLYTQLNLRALQAAIAKLEANK
jgi:hypothetical protein